MIYVYTTPSCSGCKKAKEWLDERHLKYTEKNIFQKKLTKSDVLFILKNTEEGFDDIISKRSKIIMENHIDIDTMKFDELVNFIIENPSCLRRPIIVSDDRMQVGYNEEDIGIFVPRDQRKCYNCPSRGTSECYENVLCNNLREIKNEKTN